MNGRNYLVVGGSSGIGHVLASKLSEEGANVYSASRNQPDHIHLAAHIMWDVIAEDLDVQSLPDILHGIAYCPGSINLKPIRSLKIDDFRKDFEINVLGAVKAVQATYKLLRKADQASIVMFSTVAVTQGMPFHASTASAKGAVEGLVRSLAAELAPNVRVNAVAPSLTDTPMAEKLLSTDDRREKSAERHPLKRVGTAEEVANLAYYLLSPSAGWISGQVIGIDGGMSRLRV